LSAAEVTQIITAVNASEARVKDYIAKLLVGTWSDADGNHPGVWPVVVANQRRIDALAKTPTPATPATVPVTLTDTQVQQILAALPAATVAAITAQWNK
jgi:hypothetical protein